MMSFVAKYLMLMMMIIIIIASTSKSAHCLSTLTPSVASFLTQTVEPTMLMRRVIPNFGGAGQDSLVCRRLNTHA